LRNKLKVVNHCPSRLKPLPLEATKLQCGGGNARQTAHARTVTAGSFLHLLTVAAVYTHGEPVTMLRQLVMMMVVMMMLMMSDE